jgi:glucokinase
VASGAAVTAAARARVAADPAHPLHRRLADVTGRDVAEAAAQGDQACAEVVALAGAACGRAVANLVNLLTPAGVGFGGSALSAGSPYVAALRAATYNEVLPWLRERCPFSFAQLGERAGVTGALELARQRPARAGPA